jgi:acetoin utilization deacetylase AcuC-like enzyme
MKVIFSKKCLEYRAIGHPESPRRVYNTFKFLKKKGIEFVEPKVCDEKDLLLVHEKEFIERVKNGNFYDFDTPNLPGMYDYAKLAAGSAIQAMELALKDEKTFSLMRPPGHHAGKNFLGGFCYFNNIAIASKKALEFVEKVAIIDIDCHHGNGTQDIFLGNPRVLYVSLHRYPFYPGTGKTSEKNCLNYPLKYDTTRKEYILTLDKALKEVKKYNPSLIGVSAGFDTHKNDPVGGLNLRKKTYFRIGEMIKELERPTFAVLEGGYGRTLPECVYQFLVGIE